MKVIFMGTPHFAVPALQALIDSARHEVVAVYSQPPRPAGRGQQLTKSPVHELADQYGIAVHTPVSLKNEAAQQEFAAHGADIALVAAYGLLLPQAILDTPKQGCINIHPSELPRWRGAAPLQRTIMAGDKTTACCIMQMDIGLDTGDVILRQKFDIPHGLNFGALHDAMARIGASLAMEALDAIEDGRAERTPQPKDGVYAAKLTKADQPLDFRRTASQVHQHILGLSPAPGATMELHGETIKVFNAAEQNAGGDKEKAPGTVLDDFLTINCGEGTALRLTELQRPGKKRQDAAAFMQGFPVPAGTTTTLPKN